LLRPPSLNQLLPEIPFTNYLSNIRNDEVLEKTKTPALDVFTFPLGESYTACIAKLLISSIGIMEAARKVHAGRHLISF